MLGLSTLASALGNHLSRDAAELDNWIALMNATLTMNAPIVHNVATKALSILFRSPQQVPSLASCITLYLGALEDTNLGNDARAAHASALAQVPISYYIESKRWQEVFSALLKGTSQSMSGAEGRVTSVFALQSLLFRCDKSHIPSIFSIDKLLEALFDATNDYSTDARGDVGSWVRAAAMKTLTSFVLYLDLPKVYLEKVIAVLLKQCCERIDSISATGFKCLKFLFLGDEVDRPYLFKNEEDATLLADAQVKDLDISGFTEILAAVTDFRYYLCTMKGTGSMSEL